MQDVVKLIPGGIVDNLPQPIFRRHRAEVTPNGSASSVTISCAAANYRMKGFAPLGAQKGWQVTCADIDNLITLGPESLLQEPGAVEHLVRCKECCTLVRLLQENGKSPGPEESQVKQIQARIIGNLRPVRPLAPARFFLFACAIIFLGVLAIGVVPPSMNGWAALGQAQRIVVFTTLAASAIVLAISMIGQMVPGNKYAIAPRALPIGVLAAILVIIAVTFRPHEESAFFETGLACVRNGISLSVPSAFLFWLLLRRGAMLRPKLIGAAAGGLAGLVGLAVLELNCSNLNVFHILVWHWGVVLISAGAGTLLGAAVEYIQRRLAGIC